MPSCPADSILADGEGAWEHICGRASARQSLASLTQEVLGEEPHMSFKVMAVCAGRKGGNGEMLAKERLLQHPGPGRAA